ncbi:high mobility group box domain-containing protein, partial [Mycena galericulata]
NRVPRPRNQFIIFRNEWAASEAQRTTNLPHWQRTRQTTLSREASKIWKNMSTDQRLPYMQKAEEERREHAAKYPNYHY